MLIWCHLGNKNAGVKSRIVASYHAVGEVFAAHLDEFNRRRALVLRVRGELTADGFCWPAALSFILKPNESLQKKRTHHREDRLHPKVWSEVLVDLVLLTWDTLSERPLVSEGSEEVGDLGSDSDRLISGTKSFWNMEESQRWADSRQEEPRGGRVPRPSPVQGRRWGKRACSAAPACSGWC